MLQFLQYHQQLEKSSETAKFEDLVWAGSVPTTTTESADKYVQDDLDEKAVEESLKVWYGLNRRNNIVNFENMPSTGSRLGKLPSIMLLASMWTTLAGKMYKI